MTKTVKPREHRIPIMFSDSELAAIDDWRFANRIATRADAVRRLIQIGLTLSSSSDIIGKAVSNLFLIKFTTYSNLNWLYRDEETPDIEAIHEEIVDSYVEITKEIQTLLNELRQILLQHKELIKEPDIEAAIKNHLKFESQVANRLDHGLFIGFPGSDYNPPDKERIDLGLLQRCKEAFRRGFP